MFLEIQFPKLLFVSDLDQLSKANKILGWKHQRSLADSVTSAWAWEQFAAKLTSE